MVADLQTDTNQNYRLFEKFHTESKAVVLSLVAAIVATLSVLMAWMAVFVAMEANSTVDMQNQRLEEMRDMIATQDVKIAILEKEIREAK